MVERFSTAATLLCFIGIQALAAAESKASPPLFAVVPFAAPANDSFRSISRNVQPAFVSQLTKSGQARVIKEQNLRQAISRLGLQKKGLLNGPQAKKLGQKLRVDYVISGAIELVGASYAMTTRLTNVSTGEIEWTETLAFRNMRSFRSSVSKTTLKILRKIRPTK